MIDRYSDHAANERTFPAWIRTAIAVMAFGFLVERFDLFLQVAARSLPARAPSESGRLVADVAGLLLIVPGGSMRVGGGPGTAAADLGSAGAGCSFCQCRTSRRTALPCRVPSTSPLLKPSRRTTSIHAKRTTKRKRIMPA